MTFLMNAWYMAAWSDELGDDLLRRRLLDMPVLLYRTGDGQPVAMISDEDKPIIEAAYANLDGADFWDARPAFLGIDAGGTRARRLIQNLIAQERAAA